MAGRRLDIKRILNNLFNVTLVLKYMQSFRGKFIIMCHNEITEETARSDRVIVLLEQYILFYVVYSQCLSTMFPIEFCNPLAANFCFVNSAIQARSPGEITPFTSHHSKGQRSLI